MERFKLERPTKPDEEEKKFILLDEKRCGYVKKNANDIFEISFAVKYEQRPGFRFVPVSSPTFPSENKCLEYLNENVNAVCAAFLLHFFVEL